VASFIRQVLLDVAVRRVIFRWFAVTVDNVLARERGVRTGGRELLQHNLNCSRGDRCALAKS
jgi:hypothetical protein